MNQPTSGSGPGPEGQGNIGSGPISLLWPPGAQPSSEPWVVLGSEAARDLGLDGLITALSPEPADRRAVEGALLHLVRDPAVVAYRQDVLADLLASPALAAQLGSLLPAVKALGRSHVRGARERSVLHQVIARLGELESFVNCVDALQRALAEGEVALAAAGWRALQRAVAQTTEDPTYRRLVQELPGLLAQARTAASITIGVNLDHNLQPVEATLLSINDRKFRGSTWLGKLFGGDAGQREGLGPLHGLPDQVSAAGSGFSPMMVPLFRDLARVLERAAQPVAHALQQFGSFNTGLLDRLGQELPFYLGAARLIRHVEARGLPMCRPAVAPEAERLCRVQDAYNLNLAMQFVAQHPEADLGQIVVTNEIDFASGGRVIILTGPNQGGKTTYLQAIGLIQVLAQAGLWVPGRSATLSPADGIYTHFPAEEKLAEGTGRFGDEAKRLHDIFTRVTPLGLVLLNESLSGTSAGESLYLAQDIVQVLRLLGARAIFATHLHELAAGIAQMNAADGGEGGIVSMVAAPILDSAQAHEGSPETNRRYKILFGPPLGRSYAREIAERYGVSFEQLRELLAGRGVL